MRKQEEFARSLALGKDFEAAALLDLQTLFPACTIKDTSDIHRHEGKKFPDFSIFEGETVKALVDAKAKKAYYKHDKYYLPISEDFINDYKYHASKIGVPCMILFLVNENSKTHKGRKFLLQNIDIEPDMKLRFNNRHGHDLSFWYDIEKLVDISHL